MVHYASDTAAMIDAMSKQETLGTMNKTIQSLAEARDKMPKGSAEFKYYAELTEHAELRRDEYNAAN